MSKKIASNDKILENISTRMDSFASTIKNQHNFNKIIESQIAQLAATVPPSDKGKILGQPKDLETTNLVDIHNATFYYTKPSEGRWIDYSLPNKKGDSGRPIMDTAVAFIRRYSNIASTGKRVRLSTIQLNPEQQQDLRRSRV
jgi:hypothetical protein